MRIEGAVWDQWASALKGAPEGVKEAVYGLINVELADANDFATHPDTPEEKRAGWCGWARGLADLSNRMAELQNGEYRRWPEYQAKPGLTAPDGAEEEDGEEGIAQKPESRKRKK